MMINRSLTMQTKQQTPHSVDESLIGRSWVAATDTATVLGFTTAGMCLVQRSSGRIQQISTDIVRAALEKSEKL
jgi:hypothetical protein